VIRYGCNKVRPRIWQEVDALYSEKMTGVFSGGLVYEFTQEPNDYGLVSVKDEDVVILDEFDSLGAAFGKTPKQPTIPSSASNPTRPVDCPAASKLSGITANFTLPTTQGAEYIKNGVDKTKFVKGKFVSSPTFTTTHKRSPIRLSRRSLRTPSLLFLMVALASTSVVVREPVGPPVGLDQVAAAQPRIMVLVLQRASLSVGRSGWSQSASPLSCKNLFERLGL